MARPPVRSKILLIFKAALACVAVVLIVRWVRPTGDYPEISSSVTDQWQAYGGDWHVSDGILTDRTDGRGDMMLTGPANHGDYNITSEIRFDSIAGDPQYGDAGMVIRVQDPAIGVDAHRGFYAGLRLDDHTLLIGAQSFTFRELANTQLTHEIHTGRWYRMTFAVTGCTFHASAEDMETKDHAEVSYVEPSCSPVQGQVKTSSPDGAVTR